MRARWSALIVVVLMAVATVPVSVSTTSGGWRILDEKTNVSELFPSGIDYKEVVDRGQTWSSSDIYADRDEILKQKSGGGGLTTNSIMAAVGAGALAGALGSIKGTAIGAGLGIFVAATTMLLSQKIGDTSLLNNNIKRASKRVIEMACQNFLYLYDAGEINENDQLVVSALSDIKSAVKIGVRATEKNDLDDVTKYVVRAVEKLESARTTAVVVRRDTIASTSDIPAVSGGIYVGLPAWFNVENINTYVENEFEFISVRDDLPFSVRIAFTDLKDLIVFAERTMGLNMRSIKTMYIRIWMDTYLENASTSYIGSEVEELANTVIESIKNDLEEKKDALISAGTTPDFIARYKNMLDKLAFYARVKDYTNLKLTAETCINMYLLESERLKVVHENQLVSLEAYYRKVQEIVDFALRKGLAVGDVPVRMSRVQATISSDVRDLLRRGEVVTARTKLENVIDELRNIENEMRQIIGSVIPDYIEVTPSDVMPVKNTGGRVYFRQVFIIKNTSGITVTNTRKVIGSVPEGVSTAYAAIYKYTKNLDARIKFEGSDVVIDIVSAAPNATAQVSVWYWLQALEITQTREIVSCADTLVTLKYTLNLKNNTNVYIKDIPLTIPTNIPQVRINKVDVIYGARKAELSGTDVVLTLSIAPGEVVDVAFCIVVEGLDKNISLITPSAVIENWASENSDYIVKTAQMRITNKLGSKLDNVQINIPVVQGTYHLILLDRFGDVIMQTTIPPGSDVVSIPANIAEIPTGGLYMYIVYKIPNEKVWVELMLDALAENIKEANYKVELAGKYGVNTQGILLEISEARTALTSARQAYEQKDYALAKEYIHSGLERISETLAHLKHIINSYMTEENRALMAIDLADNKCGRLGRILTELSQLIPSDLLEVYRVAYNDAVSKVSQARQAIIQGKPTEAMQLAEDAIESAEREIGNISVYVEQAISGLSTRVNMRLADLRDRISEAENYGIDTTSIRIYLSMAENDLTAAMNNARSGFYSTAKELLNSADQATTTGINTINTSIARVGRNIMDNIYTAVVRLNKSMQEAFELVENYYRAVGQAERDENYPILRNMLNRLNSELATTTMSVNTLKESAENVSDYLMILKNRREIESEISRITSELNDVKETMRQAIYERKQQAEILISSMEQMLLDTAKAIREISSVNKSLVVEYEETTENLRLALQKAKLFYNAGAYTLARDYIADYYRVATNIYSEVMATYNTLPNPLVGRITMILLATLVALVVFAAYIYRRNKLRPILQGSLRNPEGTTYPPL